MRFTHRNIFLYNGLMRISIHNTNPIYFTEAHQIPGCVGRLHPVMIIYFIHGLIVTKD